MRAFSLSLFGLAGIAASALLIAGCGTSEPPTANQPPAGDVAAEDVTVVTFANESCPIMGGAPKAELTRQWNGKTIGFCCEGCPEDWDALSEEEKAEKFAEASTGEASHDHGDHDAHEHSDNANHNNS